MNLASQERSDRRNRSLVLEWLEAGADPNAMDKNNLVVQFAMAMLSREIVDYDSLPVEVGGYMLLVEESMSSMRRFTPPLTPRAQNQIKTRKNGDPFSR